MMSSTTAIVLAGGRSRRFGSDKRLALVDGVPMLDRVIGAAGTVAGQVVLVVEPGAGQPGRTGSPGRRDPGEHSDAEPPSPSLAVVEDRLGHAGPLAALEVGLGAAVGSRVIVVAGDMPWLAPGVLGALLRSADDGGTWALEARPGDHHAPVFPFAGPTRELLEATAALLRLGERRLGGLLLAVGVHRLPADRWLALDPAGRTTIDVDLPGDLTAPGGD